MKFGKRVMLKDGGRVTLLHVKGTKSKLFRYFLCGSIPHLWLPLDMAVAGRVAGGGGLSASAK